MDSLHQIDINLYPAHGFCSSSGSGTTSSLDLAEGYFPTRPVVKFFGGGASEADLYTEDSVWTVKVTQYPDNVGQTWERVSKTALPNAREQVDRYLDFIQKSMSKREPTPIKKKEKKKVSFKLVFREPFLVRSDEEEEAMWEDVRWTCKARADLI